LKLEPRLDVVKYPLWVQTLLYDTTWGRPPYWLSTNIYIFGADSG